MAAQRSHSVCDHLTPDAEQPPPRNQPRSRDNRKRRRQHTELWQAPRGTARPPARPLKWGSSIQSRCPFRVAGRFAFFKRLVTPDAFERQDDGHDADRHSGQHARRCKRPESVVTGKNWIPRCRPRQRSPAKAMTPRFAPAKWALNPGTSNRSRRRDHDRQSASFPAALALGEKES